MSWFRKIVLIFINYFIIKINIINAGIINNNNNNNARSTSHHIINKIRECTPQEVCVDIKKCPFFLNLLEKSRIPRPESIVRLIMDYQCSSFINNNEITRPEVCCDIISANKLPTNIHQEPKIIIEKEIITPQPPLHLHRNFHQLPVLDNCGNIADHLSTRITYGRKTALEEFPWMVLIAYNTSVGLEFRCGGTIINEKFILTAAHCILNSAHSSIIGVRLGEYDLKTSTSVDCNEDNYCSPTVQDLYIENCISHPEYNLKTHANDIALIKLSGFANFSYSNVKPICLPVTEFHNDNEDDDDDLSGKSVIISGWGLTENGELSSVPLKTSIPVHPISDCKKIYANLIPISLNQICAGGEKGKDSCAGDSGGPLMYASLNENGNPRYVQYGIVSFGPKECGSEGKPGIYTRIKPYLPWILDNIN